MVIAACLQPQPFPAYATAVLLGLCACLLGDVFLIFSSDRLFLFGLIAFLAGHLFYAWAFYSLVINPHFPLALKKQGVQAHQQHRGGVGDAPQAQHQRQQSR